MITLNSVYYSMTSQEPIEPSWMKQEGYENCESSMISKLLSWFAK